MEYKYKYHRTYHLPWSPGATSDDKMHNNIDFFNGKEIIISEKLDGENTTMMNDYIYARSVDSVDHPSRHWVKGLWGNIKFNIPDKWRICGENMYAMHSIHYKNLDSYFYVFSIWDENNICLSWDDTVTFSKYLNLETVPVLWKGIYNKNFIENFKINENSQEGFVIRLADSFHYDDFHKSVAKWVRHNHVKTEDHWMFKKITPNELKSKIN